MKVLYEKNYREILPLYTTFLSSKYPSHCSSKWKSIRCRESADLIKIHTPLHILLGVSYREGRGKDVLHMEAYMGTNVYGDIYEN
jgi:hypothetical protein